MKKTTYDTTFTKYLLLTDLIVLFIYMYISIYLYGDLFFMRCARDVTFLLPLCVQ